MLATGAVYEAEAADGADQRRLWLGTNCAISAFVDCLAATGLVSASGSLQRFLLPEASLYG